MKSLNLMKSSTALAAHMAARPVGVSMPRADAGVTAAGLVEINAALKSLREDVMPKAERALKEAERTGTVSAELKAQIDEVLPKFNEASQLQAKLEGKLEALETRNSDLEQLVASGGRGGPGAATSFGREVAESDSLKAYVAGGCSGSFRMVPQAAITRTDGSGGGVTWSERETDPVNIPQRALRIIDLLNVVSISSEKADYPRQTLRTNSAAPVAEGGTAPESAAGWTKAEAIVRKLAHHINVSEEALADAPQLQGLLDGEMRYGLDLVREQQVLTGDGTGENLSGLVTEATAFSAAAGLPNVNQLDRLRLAILQVTLNDYAATGTIMNPTDWAGIELLKDGDGKYIIGGADAPAGPSLWRLPVVESTSMTANSWLVGSMFMAATLYDREQNEVLISSEHGTNFIDGMLTMKASTRLALGVKRPSSLVTGNFTFP